MDGCSLAVNPFFQEACSVLAENAAGSGQIGGSPRLVVLYGVTACISDTFSLNARDIVFTSLVRECSS